MPSALYRPVKIGPLELPGNLFLAPVSGYTDWTFRTICAGYGADFSFTELASAEALVRGGKATFDIVRRAESEKPYAVQLFGHDPQTMYQAALALAPFRPEAVDINSGCPVTKVVKTGAGSALMKDPARMGRIVEGIVRASKEALGDVPVTIKMRSGWDSQTLNYPECARIAVEAGASMVTLHPRTRAQGYEGKSDWSHIADLVSRLSVPVTGSGDLYSPEDAGSMLSQTGCAAVMFARGSEGNPFIFPATRSFLATGAWEPEPFQERVAVAFRHLTLLAASLGEKTACREMRKQFCAYIKGPAGKPGMPGSAALRNRLVQAQTIEEYRTILDEFGHG
ncbi:MAG: tRNA dihydrouridine synthase DusB [Treponema sp.]|nr:tRNA dihydrouridine synthase DusB [Treponema sp.]